MLSIGTSGWQYRDWRGRFYPEGLPQRRWLEHYAGHFPVVEINNAFYRLPERSTFEQWRARTPNGFVFAVKMSRYLTHVKRLRDPAEPVGRFLERADALGDKLGPVLLQLPPTLRADLGALDETLAQFPARVRVVVEPRHPTWFTDECRALLAKRGAALCWADRRGRPVTPLWVTAGFGYLRLHEGRANPRPRYGRTALKTWARRLDAVLEGRSSGESGAAAGWSDGFVFFNNDPGGAAVVDADAMIALLDR